MPKPRIYVETTIPSMYHSGRNDLRTMGRRDATREWWEIAVTSCDLITAVYIQHKLMPANPHGDALHLALASHHACDVLATWNYHHLANPNKLDRIKRLNELLGLAVPRILTPQHLLGEVS